MFQQDAYRVLANRKYMTVLVGDLQINKLKRASSDVHQMSLVGVPCLMSQGHWGPCAVRSNASWVMATWGPPSPPCEEIDRHG